MVSQGNLSPQWYAQPNYWFGNYSVTAPNIQWQGTSSGATYTSASAIPFKT